MKKSVNRFLKEYNEWLSIPIALMLFFVVPTIYRYFDHTASAFDPGYLHSIILGFIIVNFASGIAWLMLRLNFPTLYHFWDNDMEDSTIKSTNSEAVKVSMKLYLIFFIAFVVIVLGIINSL